MTSVDEMAHEAEVEAEVLRAVACFSAERAQEFLLTLVLKIRRQVTPARAVALPPAVVRKTSGGLTTDVLEFVRGRGGWVSGDDVRIEVGAGGQVARNRISTALTYLHESGGLLRRGPRCRYEYSARLPPEAASVELAPTGSGE